MSRAEPKGLKILVGVAVVSFVFWVVVAIVGGEWNPPRSRKADSYSTSALGHHALVALLRRLEIPVRIGRFQTAEHLGPHSVLLVAEPPSLPSGSAERALFDAMLARAHAALVVLPKWDDITPLQRARHVHDILPVPTTRLRTVLDALGLTGASVVRVSREDHALQTAADLTAPSRLPPTLQLVSTQKRGSTRIGTPEGALLLAPPDLTGNTLLLTDPDLISNAGLHRGSNAAFIVSVLNALRGPEGTVVVDETLHGYVRPPSVWRELFAFPLVVVAIQALLCLLVLLAAGVPRFGPPEVAPRALEAGSRVLIENIADLLRHGGHHVHALRRYRESVLRSARKALHAPPDWQGDDLSGWLDRIAQHRGIRERIGNLRPRAGLSATNAVTVARRLHAWREALIHGSPARPSDL